MSEKDKQTIINTLEVIASALSVCETDKVLVLHNKLVALYSLIDELKGVAK